MKGTEDMLWNEIWPAPWEWRQGRGENADQLTALRYEEKAKRKAKKRGVGTGLNFREFHRRLIFFLDFCYHYTILWEMPFVYAFQTRNPLIFQFEILFSWMAKRNWGALGFLWLFWDRENSLFSFFPLRSRLSRSEWHTCAQGFSFLWSPFTLAIQSCPYVTRIRGNRQESESHHVPVDFSSALIITSLAMIGSFSHCGLFDTKTGRARELGDPILLLLRMSYKPRR